MASTRIRLGAALAALAVAAPVAAAKPIPGGEPPRAPETPAVSVQKIVVTRDLGFDWSDAAIGGAVAAGLLGAAGAGMLLARRSREDTGSALGAH